MMSKKTLFLRGFVWILEMGFFVCGLYQCRICATKCPGCLCSVLYREFTWKWLLSLAGSRVEEGGK